MAADPITATTVSNLFNYDVDSDDPFDISTTKRPGALTTRDDKPTLSPRPVKRTADGNEKDPLDLDLGLDAEVQITKKRKPNPKLDEARLLSAPGLPKLRTLAQDGRQLKKKLGLKGKGHEFGDVAKLLSHYQLWLDDLYPRAKFRDGLAMVEKAGHAKNMQRVRRGWIDEGKPGYIQDPDRVLADVQRRESVQQESARVTEAPAAKDDNNPAPRDAIFRNGLDDHDDDMFFPTPSKKQAENDHDHEPEEDELDALLAAQNAAPSKARQMEPESEGDDDLDALLAEQDFMNQNDTNENITKPARKSLLDDDDQYDDDLEALDALLAAQESRVEVETEAALPDVSTKSSLVQELARDPESESRRPVFSSSPIPNINHPDELDALLAEQETRSS